MPTGGGAAPAAGGGGAAPAAAADAGKGKQLHYLKNEAKAKYKHYSKTKLNYCD